MRLTGEHITSPNKEIIFAPRPPKSSLSQNLKACKTPHLTSDKI